MNVDRLGVVAAVAAVSCWAASAGAATAPLVVEGRLTNLSGGPAADGEYEVTLGLYVAESGEQAAWTKGPFSVSVKASWFAIDLDAGGGGPSPTLFGMQKSLWLGIKIGSDPELARTPLAAVPYAYYAEWAGAVACVGCIKEGMLGGGSVTAAKVGFAYAGTSQGVKGGAAGDLACTGCVGLDELAASVTNAFVQKSGGTINGKLSVSGGLDLTGSTATGVRLEQLDTSKIPCSGSDAGHIAFDPVVKKLVYCDGATWQGAL